MARGNVLAVVGGQYGSEGKGVLVNHLAPKYGIHVRVGGPNAGHSFYHDHTLFKMQSIPCGWTNPTALLVLGRGALVDFEQVSKEVNMLEDLGYSIRHRLFIDGNAMVLDHRHHEKEGGTAGELHKRIGSTGHGVGAARHARMMRDPTSINMVKDVAAEYGLGGCVDPNTSESLCDYITSGQDVLLEGTQGCGLSLIHGPWPYVTSADTNAAQFAADIGIAPRWINRTLVVFRSHPIRVAGNSGPLKDEITWSDLSARLGRPVLEQTTVTKKVRRVGEWDWQLFRDAIRLNDPTSMALTFADYMEPSDEGKTDFNEVSDRVRRFIRDMESTAGVSVALIGTGGPEWNVIQRYVP